MTTQNEDMIKLFEGAIDIQRTKILESESMIAHYLGAIDEIKAQDAIGITAMDKVIDVEPADPKMLEICNAIVKDCA